MTDTIRACLQQSRERLQQFPIPELEAECLLSAVLQQQRAYLYTYLDHRLSLPQWELWQDYLQRREQGEPLAYIVGYKAFWTLDFVVTPNVLIPRPETEGLVEQALALMPENEPIVCLDAGTGCGAIGCSLAYERPCWQILACDNSYPALKVAQKNSQAFQLINFQVVQSHWLRAFAANQYHLIVSNPPYIDLQDENCSSDVQRYEPSAALFSEQQGLADIAQLITQAKYCLKPHGWLLLEHGFNQGQTIRKLFLSHGYESVQTIKDLASHERITLGIFPKK